MYKFGRKVAILLMSAIVLLSVSGCGDKQPSSDSSTTASSAPSVATEAAKPVTLKWLVMGDKYQDTEKVISAYNDKLKTILPATTVEFELINVAEYKQKWDLKMAAREKMDLAWTGYLFSYFSEVQKGSFKELDGLIEQYGGDITKEIPSFILDKQRVNGKLYSVPNHQLSWFRGNAIRGPKALMDQVDIDEIGRINRSNMYSTKEGYDAIETYFAKAKESGNIQLGLSTQTFRWIADKGLEGLNGEQSPFVIRYFDTDLKAYNKYETEEYKIFYGVMADWYKKGYIRKDILSIQNPRADDGKPNGSILWVHGYTQQASEQESKLQGFPMVVEPLDGYKYISFDASNTATAIPGTSENPERALQLMNIMSTSLGGGVLKTLSYGLEGEHFKVVEGNVVERLKDENNKLKYTIADWVVGNVFNSYETTDGYNQMVSDYMEKCLISPLAGFKLDTSSIMSEIAQVDALVKEFHDPLSTGALPDWEKKYAEFLDKMKKAGSDKIIEEIQKQIDAFAKVNEKSVKERQKAYADGWNSLQNNPNKFIYDGFFIDN